MSQVQTTPAPQANIGGTTEEPIGTATVEEEVEVAVPKVESTPSEEVSADEGMGLTVENVEEIIDEYIRPGVAADEGDIQLIKIEDNDVYVKLTGACQAAPSAIMTMKMGVEALLREEFPSMRELIDETEYAA